MEKDPTLPYWMASDHTHHKRQPKGWHRRNNASLECVKRNVEGRVSDRMSQKQKKQTNTRRKKDRVLPGTTFLIFIPCIGTPLGSAKAPRIWKGSRKKNSELCGGHLWCLFSALESASQAKQMLQRFMVTCSIVAVLGIPMMDIVLEALSSTSALL